MVPFASCRVSFNTIIISTNWSSSFPPVSPNPVQNVYSFYIYKTLKNYRCYNLAVVDGYFYNTYFGDILNESVGFVTYLVYQQLLYSVPENNDFAQIISYKVYFPRK